MRALQAWLESRHLETVVLEIFNPKTDALVGRWDIDVIYTTGSGDGGFWTDTEQIKYHVRKAGLAPNEAKYRLLLQNKPGRPDVDGWGTGGIPIRRKGSLATALARQSNTMAWAAARPIGGRPDADCRRGVPEIQGSS
jgi:hypothetical protein